MVPEMVPEIIPEMVPEMVGKPHTLSNKLLQSAIILPLPQSIVDLLMSLRDTHRCPA
jgi:hypothetical protein